MRLVLRILLSPIRLVLTILTFFLTFILGVGATLLNIISNATLDLFAMFYSNDHMAWMRTVAGRLKGEFKILSSGAL